MPSACGDKKRFYSKAEARRIARKTMAQMGERTMGAYRCPTCQAFHVGHDSPPRRRSFVCGRCRAPVVSTADRFGVDVVWEPHSMRLHGCA